MKSGNSILDYLSSLDESRLMLRSPGILLPFVVFAALQCMTLFLLGFFAAPPLSGFMVPVVQRLGGDDALHYPMHFILMPSMYHDVYLPMAAVVGFSLYGWAVFLMGDHYERMGTRVGVRPSYLRSLPAMIVIGIVYVALVTAVPTAFAYFGSRLPDPRLVGLMTFTGFVAAAVIQVYMIYALVFVRAKGLGPWGAFRFSMATGRDRFGVTLLLVASVMLIHQPLDFLLREPDKVVLRFSPELVLYALLGSVVLELVTSYFLFASTTALVLSRREEAPH